MAVGSGSYAGEVEEELMVISADELAHPAILGRIAFCDSTYSRMKAAVRSSPNAKLMMESVSWMYGSHPDRTASNAVVFLRLGLDWYAALLARVERLPH